MSEDKDIYEGDIIEIVDGEVIDEGYEGPNLDFNLNEVEITGEDVAYGYTKNQSYKNNYSLSENTFRSMGAIPEDKAKFKTVAYLNKKTINALNRELDTLKKEILEAYELAVKSSATEYRHIFTLIKGNSKSIGSEMNIIIGNTIYQYRVHSLSIENICDNLSLRLAFSGANGHNRSLVRTASAMKRSIEEYKYHMNILVPIVLDKLNGSWYELELNQLDITLGLLTPKLFNSYEASQLTDFYMKESENGFNSIHSSQKIDSTIVSIILNGFENFYNPDNADKLGLDFATEGTVIDFLETLEKESNESGHIVIEYPSLGELASMIIHNVGFDSFCRMYELDAYELENFNACLGKALREALEKNPEVRDYRFRSNEDKYSLSQGSIYKDLSIPELFKSWCSIYRTPFSDREVINIFLSNYQKMCDSCGITCSLPSDNKIDYLLSGKLHQDEYYEIINYLNKSIYSRRTPITTLGEYAVYVSQMHERLGLPEPASGGESDSIYDGIGYMSDRVNFIDKVFTDSISEKFNIKCDCGIVTDSEFMEVSDYLTTIRVDPNHSGDTFDFDFEDTMKMNISLIEVDSESFNEIGQLVQKTSSFIDQTLSICPQCGKIHLFSESVYRALDICAQKFLSERRSSDTVKFVQRCTLSKECVAEFSNDFYSYFESKGMSNYDELPLNLPEVDDNISEMDKEKEEKDFSKFGMMATSFIDNLLKNKEQYKYMDELEELKMVKFIESGENTVPNTEEMLESLEKSNENTLSVILEDKKKVLDTKYYNNFIWYFISNNLTIDLDVEFVLKLRLSELMGKDNIIKIENIYKKMKTTLYEIGKNQFHSIRSLNNMGGFPTVDLAGDSVSSEFDIPAPSSDKNVKQFYKYLNLAKRALRNSESFEEFKANLDLCNINGKLLDSSIKEILIDEYNGNGNFEYSNSEIIDKLSSVCSESKFTRSELYAELYRLRDEITRILSSIDFNKNTDCYEYYTDFDLQELLIILGCFLSKQSLKTYDVSKDLNTIEDMGGKFLNRLIDSFTTFDDGASDYLNYLLSTVEYNFNYEEVKDSDLISNLISNYGLICREYIESSDVTLTTDSKLTTQLKDYCIIEVKNNASCRFHKRILADMYSKASLFITKSIELDFTSFAFNILKTYPVDLYNARLVNSVLGKGTSKLLKQLSDPTLDKDAVKKALSAFPNVSDIFPRMSSAKGIIRKVKDWYAKSPEYYEFKIYDSTGNEVNNPKVLDKVRVYILSMFILMNINKCLEIDECYETDIFKAFNLIFNLPSSYLNSGLKDVVSDLKLKDLDLSYDYLNEHIDDLCENNVILDCIKGSRIITHSLEKSQIDELVMISKLCIDTSIIPYRASSGLISSELSNYQ